MPYCECDYCRRTGTRIKISQESKPPDEGEELLKLIGERDRTIAQLQLLVEEMRAEIAAP